MKSPIIDSVSGVVLKYEDQYIREDWRRGHFDRDHKVIRLTSDINEATVYISGEVPVTFENYRNLDASYFFNNAVEVKVTRRCVRDVVLKTIVEVLN